MKRKVEQTNWMNYPIRDVTIMSLRPQDMRYRTVGDWQLRKGQLNLSIADTGDWRYNALIAIHEHIEAFLATANGITPEQVDEFDFEHQDDEDPGSLKDCPIYRQHMIALAVEILLANELGIDWREYEKCLDKIAGKIPLKA